MCVAGPIGLFSGIYLAEYASTKVRKYSKPIIEILAGIPTVVYGFFAALTVGPFFRTLGESLGLTVSSESALAAGLIMGVMIIPYISSLSDDVINSVPQSLREGSYAIGATKSETIKKVVIPKNKANPYALNNPGGPNVKIKTPNACLIEKIIKAIFLGILSPTYPPTIWKIIETAV